MERREPPETEEGWYVLHDLRRVDWDAWREAPERERRQALAEGIEYLRAHENLDDAESGWSAVFSVLGHKADLLAVHMRPTPDALDLAERRFEQTAFAAFTERATSYVSVTEVSGYTTDALAEGGIEDVEEAGLRNYLQSRLYPEVPDAAHVCFYPMDKRRGPGDNWYDLPFEERADLMRNHGEIGREYAGKVTQVITGSVGFDDYEWGVTLFADDPTAIKHLLYEMRFDPSTSRFAEFGPFYFGRRFPPEDLDALLAGEPVPTDAAQTDDERPPVGATGDAREAGATGAAGTAGATGAAGTAGATGAAGTAGAAAGSEQSVDSGGGNRADSAVDPADSEADAGEDETGPEPESGPPSGGPPTSDEPPHEPVDREVVERELQGVGIRPDEYPEAGYALVFPSSADAENLVDDLDDLRGNFEHYETHVLTTVRAEAGQSEVVSLWANQRAADTASGFLADLSGVQPGIGGPLGGDAGSGGTDDSNGSADSEAERGAGDEAAPDDADAGGIATGGDAALREELAEQDIYAGQPHGQDVYAVVVYSEAPSEALDDELADLREQFAAYDSHVETTVYENAREGGPAAVASLWETQDGAATAGEFLADLPGVVRRADGGDGFETLGMFYTVEPEHRSDFRERFEAVGDLLADMEGHRETDLLVNRADENDMFVASRWRSKEDALDFFRSDAFRNTVQWGREVLADRPRHVFLA